MRIGFHDGYCAWQNSVLLIGLARLLAIDDDDPAVERGFRAGCEALLELGRYDDGGFIYLDRFDYRWVSRQAHLREALAAAHALTDDERYLPRASRAAPPPGSGRAARARRSATTSPNGAATSRSCTSSTAPACSRDLTPDELPGVTSR